MKRILWICLLICVTAGLISCRSLEVPKLSERVKGEPSVTSTSVQNTAEPTPSITPMSNTIQQATQTPNDVQAKIEFELPEFGEFSSIIETNVMVGNDEALWLVYKDSLYAVDVDGENLCFIDDVSSYQLCLWEQYLYYVKDDGVYRMSIDDGNCKRIIRENHVLEVITKDGQTFYYTVQRYFESDTYSAYLYYHDIKTRKKERITDEAYGGMRYYNDTLYYTQGPCFIDPEVMMQVGGEMKPLGAIAFNGKFTFTSDCLYSLEFYEDGIGVYNMSENQHGLLSCAEVIHGDIAQYREVLLYIISHTVNDTEKMLIKAYEPGSDKHCTIAGLDDGESFYDFYCAQNSVYILKRNSKIDEFRIYCLAFTDGEGQLDEIVNAASLDTITHKRCISKRKAFD